MKNAFRKTIINFVWAWKNIITDQNPLTVGYIFLIILTVKNVFDFFQKPCCTSRPTIFMWLNCLTWIYMLIFILSWKRNGLFSIETHKPNFNTKNKQNVLQNMNCKIQKVHRKFVKIWSHVWEVVSLKPPKLCPSLSLVILI